MLSKIGHELRSPLTGIMGLARIMLVKLDAGSTDPAQQARQLRLVLTSAEQMMQTVNRIAAIATLDGAACGGEAEPYDCRDLVTDIVTALRATADSQGRSVSVHLPDTALLTRVNRQAANRILAELLDNAIKYTAGDTVDITAVAATGGRGAVMITDPGPGIDPDEQARLLTPFERGRAAEHTGIPGTGLGLYVAARLAAQIGARLSVDSADPGGTTITVDLPPTEPAHPRPTTPPREA